MPKKFAKFKPDTPGGLGYVGVMINFGRRVRQEFMFSDEALQEYALETPGFDWKLYRQDAKKNEIARTDPQMIDIVRRIGPIRASAEGCHIIIQLVPWQYRNDIFLENGADDKYNEVIVLPFTTLQIPK
jgi:hypothetical protein